MANTYDDIIPKILAQGLSVLRGVTIMPRLVNRNYDGAAAEQGSVINVPIPPSVTTVPVTPSATAPDAAGVTFSTTPVELAYHEEAPFAMGDKERTEVMVGAESMAVRSAAISLGNRINSTILTAMDVGASVAVGTAGTRPFGTLDLADAPFTLLDEHLIGPEDRRCIFAPNAKGRLLALPEMTSRDFVNDMSALQNGTFSGQTNLGASWWSSAAVPTHTRGTANTAYDVNSGGGLAVGATTIPVDTGTGTILAGDVVTFAGDTENQYVVATALASGSFTIAAPGLKVAIADNADVTVAAAHRSNFAFQREAIVAAFCPFQASSAGLVATDQMMDEETGISLRVEVIRQHKRDRWSLDAMWGTKVVRPEGVIKIMG